MSTEVSIPPQLELYCALYGAAALTSSPARHIEGLALPFFKVGTEKGVEGKKVISVHKGQDLGRFARVGSTHCCAYTPRRSTRYSTGVLTGLTP